MVSIFSENIIQAVSAEKALLVARVSIHRNNEVVLVNLYTRKY